MGKGLIVSNLGGGEYVVEILRDVARAQAKSNFLAVSIPIAESLIPGLQSQITSYFNSWSSALSQYNLVISGQDKNAIIAANVLVIQWDKIYNDAKKLLAEFKLLLLTSKKKKEVLDNYLAVPNSNENMFSVLKESFYHVGRNVGILEHHELGDKLIEYPYVLSKHGIKQVVFSSTPFGTYFNMTMAPVWMLQKPVIRFGYITSINYKLNIADVVLDGLAFINRDKRYKNINVNKYATISGVSMVYLSSERGFYIQTKVVVYFINQSWDMPIIIGGDIENFRIPIYNGYKNKIKKRFPGEFDTRLLLNKTFIETIMPRSEIFIQYYNFDTLLGNPVMGLRHQEFAPFNIWVKTIGSTNTLEKSPPALIELVNIVGEITKDPSNSHVTTFDRASFLQDTISYWSVDGVYCESMNHIEDAVVPEDNGLPAGRWQEDIAQTPSTQSRYLSTTSGIRSGSYITITLVTVRFLNFSAVKWLQEVASESYGQQDHVYYGYPYFFPGQLSGLTIAQTNAKYLIEKHPTLNYADAMAIELSGTGWVIPPI